MPLRWSLLFFLNLGCHFVLLGTALQAIANGSPAAATLSVIVKLPGGVGIMFLTALTWATCVDWIYRHDFDSPEE